MKTRGRPINSEKAQLLEKVGIAMDLDVVKGKGSKARISLADLRKLGAYIDEYQRMDV